MKLNLSKTYKIPGPSIFYYINQQNLDRSQLFYELAKDYGDVCRAPSPVKTILLNHPDYVQHVLQQHVDNYQKLGVSMKPAHLMLGKGLLLIKQNEWPKRRKLFSPLFQPNKMHFFESTIVNVTKNVIANWRNYETTKTPFNIAHEMLKIGLGIAATILFNTQINDEQVDKLIVDIETENYYSCSWLCALPWLPTIGNLRRLRAKKNIKNYLMSVIREHRSRNQPIPDLLDTINNKSAELQFNENELISEAKTFLLTGHETTGTALAWVWWLLGKNPTYLERLKAEIDCKVGTKELRAEDLEQLPLMDMIYKETLRLQPPVWLISRQPQWDDVIANYQIKAGTDILISPYVIHRHPEFWQQPELFYPERFNDSNNIARFTYLPYGAGPRICIASQFASLMAKLIITTICQHYDIKLLANQQMQYAHLISLKPKHGVWVYAKERN